MQDTTADGPLEELKDCKPMQKLFDYLASIQPGPISDTYELEQLLVDPWDQFLGSDEEGMTGSKLYGRIENVTWNPPILSFIIERHGGTVLGSSRAALHQWEVNIEKRTAHCYQVSHRQVRPMNPRLDVGPIAEEIAQLITNKRMDVRLQWKGDNTVRVLIGKIIPKEFLPKRTLIGRRKRFREALDSILSKAGWQKIRDNLYAPPPTE